MANVIKGNKRAVEKVLVVKGNETLPTDGTSLNGTGGIVNLNDGQIGLVDATPGSGTFNTFFNNASSFTFEQIPIAKVVQGTDMSATPSQARVPFTRRPYEDSLDIIGKQVTSYTGKAYASPKRSASVLAISSTPQELAKYSIYLGFRGRRVTEFDSGIQAVVKKKVEVDTVQYSTLGLTSDQDDLTQRLAYAINQNSAAFTQQFGNVGGNWKVMAFAIDSTGTATSGGATLTQASVAGQSINVVVTGAGTQSITTDAELAATFADVVTNTALAGTATFELINPSTFGAGSADYLLIVAMNESTAYIDRDPTTKIRIDAGAGDRFEDEARNFVVGCNPFEGQGTYRQWKIYFDNTNGQRSYSQNRDLYPVLVYPTSLVENETYGALVIEHYSSNQVQFTGTSISPNKTIVLVPNSGSGKAAVLDAFNDWLSPAFPAVTI